MAKTETKREDLMALLSRCANFGLPTSTSGVLLKNSEPSTCLWQLGFPLLATVYIINNEFHEIFVKGGDPRVELFAQ